MLAGASFCTILQKTHETVSMMRLELPIVILIFFLLFCIFVFLRLILNHALMNTVITLTIIENFGGGAEISAFEFVLNNRE